MVTTSDVFMDKNYFGEGICSLPGKNTFIRMTWTDNVVDILDSNLRVIESMPMFDGVKEGWGITRHGDTLFVSDGSEYLNLINARTFENEGRLLVTLTNGGRIKYLNELEFVNDYIWANVYQTSYIVKIDSKTGIVSQTINLTSLANTEIFYHSATNDGVMSTWDYGNNVLNGIAYDDLTGELFVTGKRWHLLYRIALL